MKYILKFTILIFYLGFTVNCIINSKEKKQPPHIVITSPSADQNFYRGDKIYISVDAIDEDGLIKKILFYIDGILVQSSNSLPYLYVWNTKDAELGNHSIKIVAIDDDDLEAEDYIEITIVFIKVTISTSLDMDIPVSVSASSAIALKSASVVTSYPFTKSGALSLSGNDDLDKYLDKIKSIEIKSMDASILGLAAGQKIETLTINVTGVGTILTLTNITSNSTITPNVSTTILDQIEAKLETDKSITATVTGSTNYAPMSFNLKLMFDVIVNAEE